MRSEAEIEVARLRAQVEELERERDDYCKTAQDHFAFAAREQARAEAAEARVKELENAWDKGAELDEAYLARIAELKATLRNIRQAAHDQFKDEQERGWISASWVADRCHVALAHEEEAK